MTDTIKRRHAPPDAGSMVEALRGLGYSTPTAIADIIDNSLSAGADTIDLFFHWAGNSSHIAIVDNGTGMTSEGLMQAMKLGARNPLDERKASDLGRFGLGLKTASFSQARRLTVATITEDGFKALRWDLDALSSTEGDGWYLLEGVNNGSEPIFEPFREQAKGSFVLWEVLDRIVTPGFTEQHFLDLIDSVEVHLGIIFHRYLEGRKSRLKIRINNRNIQAWDPFLRDHPSKPLQSPVVYAPNNRNISLECHVLPHKDKLTKHELELFQGPEGWTSQQGFYVYRNERLLVAGSWLGLGTGRAWVKDETHRLARIRLDITNTSDSEWKIDIRKSVARPPAALRSWLLAYAEKTRAIARKAFFHRGSISKTSKDEDVFQAWVCQQSGSGMRYQINRQHPAIKSVLEQSAPDTKSLNVMLRVIEETVPVQRIWLNTAENKAAPITEFDGEEVEKIQEVLEIMYHNMLNIKHMTRDMAYERLKRTEPFYKYPDLIEKIAR